MYGLIAKIIAVDGKRDDLAGILHNGSREIAGCLGYVVALDTADANTLWVTEVWETKEKHAASLSLSSVQEAIAKGRPLVAGFDERIETIPLGDQD
jgi:quinol monooxygenase YgiN